MATFLVIAAVSAALVVGAAWGAYRPVPTLVRGVLFATAGGALVVSLVLELLVPAAEDSGRALTVVAMVIGAAVFTGVDHVIDEMWDDGGGLGVLAAVTLDGIPENLALGVGLIGASLGDVGALATSIVLSNFPEAAGGADDLSEQGWSPARNLALWSGVGVVLAASTYVGKTALAGVDDAWLSGLRAFAAGAVLASLATEVFPQAFGDAKQWSGLAVAAGVALTLVVS